MTDPAPQPAVIRGLPSADLLLRRRSMLALGGVLGVAIAAMIFIPSISPGSSGRLSTAFIGSVFLAELAMALFIALRLNRLTKALRNNPHACLHCLYPLEPNAPHCPECGRLNNRQDLNEQWSKLLNAKSDG